MANTVERFEQEIRRIVRRGSKSAEYESSIMEIAAHFGDLVEEGIALGKSESEAEIEARKRLGSPLTIALQVLNSPERVLRGIRLQKLAILGLFLSVCYYLILKYCVLQGWQGHELSLFGFSFFGLFFSTGLFYGFGIMQSKKLVWKPLVGFIPAAIMTFALVEILLVPLYRTYWAHFGERSLPTITLLQALDSGSGFTVRLMTTFIILATIGYFGGRIYLLRLSMFRFIRSK